MERNRPALFRGSHFTEEIIVLCLRWCLRFPFSQFNAPAMLQRTRLASEETGGLNHDTGIRRTPARLSSHFPLPSQWRLCLLDEDRDRSLVLELFRLPGIVSLRRDRPFDAVFLQEALSRRVLEQVAWNSVLPRERAEQFRDYCSPSVVPGERASQTLVTASLD